MPYLTKERNSATIVEVSGELDVAAATHLREYMGGLFKKAPGKVILDLSGVGYMASSGLAMLIAAIKNAKECRVPFGVCGVSPVVRHSLEVAELHAILPIFNDITEAIRDLK